MATIRLNRKNKTIKIVNRKDNIKLKRVVKDVKLAHSGRRGPEGPAGDDNFMRVFHGADANYPRPDVLYVEWVGTVPPNNATIEDTWIETDALIGEMPIGGLTGQVLAKKTDSDYDYEWVALTGSVDSVNGKVGVVVLDQDDISDGTNYKQYSAAEKTKLSGIATGATANDTDGNLKNRANHTGTQTASTISDFDAEVANNSAVATNNAKISYTDGTRVAAITDPLYKNSNTTKSDVGLSNVDNTSDATKNSATATLANKTLASPKMGAYDAIFTDGGVGAFILGYYGTPVNGLVVEMGTTGVGPLLYPGGEANQDLQLSAAGTGKVDVKSNISATNLSGTNTGDQIGDGTTITGTGTALDPFVAVGGGGGGSSTIIDTKKNILLSTPTDPATAFASDTDEFVLWDGSAWHEASIGMSDVYGNDPGWILNSGKKGYSTNYITDKILYNIVLGTSARESDGSMRIDNSRSPAVMQRYGEGRWNDYTAFDFTTSTPLQHKDTTSTLNVYSGDGQTLGINGRPITQQYITCAGAYPAPLVLDGGE